MVIENGEVPTQSHATSFPEAQNMALLRVNTLCVVPIPSTCNHTFTNRGQWCTLQHLFHPFTKKKCIDYFKIQFHHL